MRLGPPASSCSSSISPTISSIRSSIVTNPSIPPNSSAHCDMRARLPHLHQKVKDRHRWGDEQHLAQNQRQFYLSPLRRRTQQILGVNEPDYVIERLAINQN